jgi:acyl dehydratase
MATKGEAAYEKFKAAIGETEGTGEWFEVTQDRIDAFADVTEDHQFIHVDPKAAAELSPWGTTIAHGFLTLSLLTHLSGSVPQPADRLDGVVMGINYGFDKVRFISPVKVGSRIRATSVLSGVEQKDAGTLQVTRTVTVEIEGESKPALVADWITRLVYAG